jgi:hypothetical protein
MMLTRRSILRGLIAAPAIVSAGSIMPVKLWKVPTPMWRTYGARDALAVKLYTKQLVIEALKASEIDPQRYYNELISRQMGLLSAEPSSWS